MNRVVAEIPSMGGGHLSRVNAFQLLERYGNTDAALGAAAAAILEERFSRSPWHAQTTEGSAKE